MTTPLSLQSDKRPYATVSNPPSDPISLRTRELAGKIRSFIKPVQNVYFSLKVRPARFIEENEVEATAKQLVQIEREKKRFRVSSTKDHCPVSAILSENGVIFCLRKTTLSKGDQRVCKLGLHENGCFMARVEGVIKNPYRWEREQNMLIDLNGQPGIITTYFLGTYSKEKGQKGLPKSVAVQELFAKDLFDIRHTPGLFSKEQKIQMIHNLLQGISVLAEKKIVHADISLENSVGKNENRGKAAIIDFGLALYENEEINPPHLGKPLYFAPERWKSPKARLSWDVWAMGIVFFTFLKLDIPSWMGKEGRGNLEEIIPHLESGWAKMPEETPPHLADLIQKMLEPDPKKRITAQEALQIFEKKVLLPSSPTEEEKIEGP